MSSFTLPRKFESLWQKCLPFLKQGRPDDLMHAEELVNFILSYKGKLKLNKDVLIPVAIMHDIGHSAILPEHFRYITGPQKITNGKLVHMLVGAKIARDILRKLKYPTKIIKEVVEIIAIHDAHQLDIDWKKIYNTKNKKIFHDIDLLDWFNKKRYRKLRKIWPKRKLMKLLESKINTFYFPEIKKIVKERLKVFDE